MEYFFKKYFWIIYLIILGIAAWVLGSGVSNYLAARFLKIPYFDLKKFKEYVKNELSKEDVSLISQGKSHFSNLAKTNPFNIDKFFEEKKEEEETKEEETAESEDKELDVSGDNFEEADIGVELIGTLVVPEKENCIATVKDQNETRIVQIGMTVGSESAEVVAIRPKYILVKVGNKIKIIKMGAKPKSKGYKYAAASSSKWKKNKYGSYYSHSYGYKHGGSKYNAWIKKTGANEYTIDKGMLMEELNDLTKLGMQARIVPNYKGGKYEGFKLIGVRPGSFYRAIGIQSGDVVKSVNGKELNSPNKAIQLFEELKNAKSIVLEIERYGKPKQLFYKIQ